MTRRYAGENVEVYELWTWYKHQIVKNTDPAIPKGWWFYGKYSNGEPIPKAARELYRRRDDLKAAFPDPYDSSQGGYGEWYDKEISAI